MGYESLGEFVMALQDGGDVIRLTDPVDSALEVAAITERVVRQSSDGGPALVFANVRANAWPVVTNLLGSERRISLALGLDASDALAWNQRSELRTPLGWRDSFARWSSSSNGGRGAVRMVRQGPCQQVVKLGRDVNLWDLPALRCWPGEASPTLTAAVCVTPSLTGPGEQLTRCPLQLADRQRLLPYWPPGHACLVDYQHYRQQRRQYPIALVFGGNPVLQFVASASEWLDDRACYEYAAAWRNQAIPTVKCRTHDLLVPAEAELIIEGLIDPDSESETLAGLALATGHYATDTAVPSIQVTAMTHRANPMLPAMVPGPPPQESTVLQHIVDRCFLPTVQQSCPGLLDVRRSTESAGLTAFVSLKKTCPRQALAAMHAVWGCAGFRAIKTLVVVDEDIDIRRDANVWAAMAANMDPQRDALLTSGPAHPDDHALILRGCGGKLGIDATRKLPTEGHTRDWPDMLRFDSEALRRLDARWPELGLPQ